MVGDNRNRWTPEQLSELRSLRAAGVPWPEVAIEVGHPIASCRQMMTHQNNAHRRQAAKETRQALREAADLVAGFWPMPAKRPSPPPMPDPAPLPLPVRTAARPGTDYARSSVSTAKLVMDAELRARIEVMGITGGLLGDPLPGRSALDRRKQAAP